MKTVTFEVYKNKEWLSHYFNCKENETIIRAGEESKKFTDICFAAGITAVFKAPRGRRTHYHGWHGAAFEYQSGIFGTFDELTPKEIVALDKYYK